MPWAYENIKRETAASIHFNRSDSARSRNILALNIRDHGNVGNFTPIEAILTSFSLVKQPVENLPSHMDNC